jgi:hypothetical protein
MEQGTLKVRVRALENERALERIAAQQATTQAIVVVAVMLNLASIAAGPVLPRLAYAAAAFFGAQAGKGALTVRKLDKKNELYSQPAFDNAGRPSDGAEGDGVVDVQPAE